MYIIDTIARAIVPLCVCWRGGPVRRTMVQSMKWTGSIRWIHNPVQSMQIWIGLDQKFTNSADSGLDWIQKCTYNVYPIFGDLRQFFLIATLTPEVLLSKLQLYTSSILFTRRFYKVFGRYLLCCVRIGLDWIHILGHQLDWTGLGSVDRLKSIHSILCHGGTHTDYNTAPAQSQPTHDFLSANHKPIPEKTTKRQLIKKLFDFHRP